MRTQALILQLLEWVGIILAGGIGLGSAFKVFKKDSLTENLGYAFGLGMLFNVILGFAFLTVLGRNLLGGAFYAILIANLAVLLIGIIGDDPFFKARPTKEDAKFAILPTVFILMLAVYFYRFPIFPEFDGSDVHANLQNAISTMQNGQPGLSGTVSYWGIFYLLALALRLDQADISLVVVRAAMAALIVVSVFIVNLTASRLFGREKSLWVAVAYSAIGVWYATVLNAGLFPNFYGMLSSLFLMVVAVDLFEQKKVGVQTILFPLALFDLLLSHYSSWLILPAVLAFAALKLKAAPGRAIGVILGITAPAGFLLFGPLRLYSTVLGATSAGGQPTISGFTWLANVLKPWPFLSFLVSFMWNDFAAVPVLLCIPVFGYLLIRKRDARLVLCAVWFVTILAVSPMNVAAWRFSIVGLLPAGLMFGYVVAKGSEVIRRTKHQSLHDYAPRRVHRLTTIPAVFCLILVVMGAGVTQVPAAFVGPSAPDYRQAQIGVYDALQWFSVHAECVVPQTLPNGVIVTKNGSDILVDKTGSGCSFLSPTSWQFACAPPCTTGLGYSQQLFGITGYFSCSDLVSPATATNDAIGHRATFLMIADETMVTCSAFPCPSPTTIVAVNSTSGTSLRVKITGDGLAGGTAVSILVNGTNFGSLTLPDNNTAYATLHFKKPGLYTIQSYVGASPSWILGVAMGSKVNPITSPWSFTACLPQHWTSSDLSGATLVYNETGVEIWDLQG